MRVRRQEGPRRRQSTLSQPLPHPSWLPYPADRRRVSAQEFWQRLGL